jgi:hypothetical protein
LTHSGTVTVFNPKTGKHRTFKVTKPQAEDAKFFPGKRLVGILTGPDNTCDFHTFGFVGDHKIILWKTHRNTPIYKWAADFLLDPEAYSDIVELKIEGRCRACGRKLTTPESVDTGIGPICGGRKCTK